MPIRRYGDDEVREILSRATTGDTSEPTLPADSRGLTLDELREVAQEAGIDPARVSHAAASLDARGTPAPVKRMLGLPIGLSRVVDLPRAPTEREWEQLISEFRTTFGVQGQATTSGGFREWSHGNLHISIEPTGRGQQLRLTTRNEGAVALNGLAVVMGLFSLIVGVSVTVAGKPEKALAVVSIFGGMAVVAFAANVLRLPGWARERARQLESAAEETIKLLSRP